MSFDLKFKFDLFKFPTRLKKPAVKIQASGIQDLEKAEAIQACEVTQSSKNKNVGKREPAV